MTNSQRWTVFSLGASKVSQKTIFSAILQTSEALGVKTVYLRELIMKLKVVHNVIFDNFHFDQNTVPKHIGNNCIRFEESESSQHFSLLFLKPTSQLFSHERILDVILCISSLFLFYIRAFIFLLMLPVYDRFKKLDNLIIKNNIDHQNRFEYENPLQSLQNAVECITACKCDTFTSCWVYNCMQMWHIYELLSV